MGYSRKNPNRVGGGGGGVEDMEFPGVSKKNHLEFPGLIKNKMEFSRVTKKK